MLAVGGLLFWILIIIVGLVLFVVVANERPGWATISVVATLLLLAWLGDFNLWTVITHNPLWAVALFFAYVALGVGWSFWKWWFFVTDKRDKFLELKAEYERVTKDGRSKTETITSDEYNRLYYSLDHLCREMELSKKPRAKDNKARILTWTIWWPWSFIWTLVDDPLKKFFKYIYKKLQATYQKIADSIYKGVDENIPPLPPENGLLAQLEDDVERMEKEAEFRGKSAK